MIGPVAILIFFFIVGPIGLMLVGAIWSALQGWLQSEDAALRAGELDEEPQPRAHRRDRQAVSPDPGQRPDEPNR